ncbi:MAG: hypothetical protein WBL23_01510 [Salinisphaera sp.]
MSIVSIGMAMPHSATQPAGWAGPSKNVWCIAPGSAGSVTLAAMAHTRVAVQPLGMNQSRFDSRATFDLAARERGGSSSHPG